MEQSKEIIISGAGLVGSLLAIALKRRGHEVMVFEKRSDMRKGLKTAGRSINLIITAKGINPLVKLGLWEKVQTITSPVYGRMMHSKSGDLAYQPYGKDESECNYSVSRAELNMLLMTEAEKAGVTIHFESELQNVDLKNKKVTFPHGTHGYDLIFGTDGAGSAARDALMKELGTKGSHKVEPLGTDYKEINMPPKFNGDYAMEKKALHIWPRGNHMLMALPNKDGSFTMTLYMPEAWYKEFSSDEALERYFQENYADAIPLMPNYKKEFAENPQGFLGIVRVKPWIYEDQLALLGDAAHAIVPFFGQGMNSGFADVQYLLEQMDQHPNDYSTILKNYNDHQKLNGDAIADLSLENFKEMCEKVGDDKFLLRKKVENKLENAFPQKFRSRYGLVTYTLIPYFLAKEVGQLQDVVLDELCQGLASIDQLNLSLAEKLIDEKIVPWFKEKKLSVSRYHP